MVENKYGNGLPDSEKKSNRLNSLDSRIQQVQSIFDIHEEGAIFTDDNGFIVHMNPAAATLIQCEKADAAGRHIDEMVHIIIKRDRMSIDDLFVLSSQADGKICLPENACLLRKDGTRLPVSGAVSSFGGPQEEITGKALIFRRCEDNPKKVLAAIRKINQLLRSEINVRQFIQRVCDILLKTMGYDNTWIAILDEMSSKTAITAFSGFNPGMKSTPHPVHGDQFPPCMKKALAQKEGVVIDNPQFQCRGCYLAPENDCRVVFIRRLSIENHIYGVMGASVPAGYVDDAEAHAFFGELADDVTAALKNIDETRERIRHASELKATFYGIGDAVISTDNKGRVRRINPVAERLTGWTENEAIGQPIEKIFNIINEIHRHPVEPPVSRVLREGVVVGLANHTLLISKDGREIPISDSGAPITDAHGNIIGVVLVFRDQSNERFAQKLIESRISLIEFAARHPLDKFLPKILDDLGKLAHSPIGFYHFISPDQKTITLKHWSTRIHKEFCIAEAKNKSYDVADAGVWADCIMTKEPRIHNDCSSLRQGNGMPEEYAELLRILAVPVIRDDKVVAVLGLGNKPFDYTRQDAKMVSYLADITWEIVLQKRSDEALRKSEGKYRLLFDNADMLLSVYDRNGICQAMNRKLAALFGGRPQDFIGKSFYELHPEAAEEYVGRIRETIDSGINKEYEDEVIFPEGPRWLLSSVHIVPDAEGNFNAAQIISQDITDRKNVENALRESKTFLDDVGRIARVGGWELDAETLEVRWTDETYRIHEVPLDYQPSLQEAIDFFHPHDHERLKNAIQRAITNGEPYDMEIRFITAKGNHLWTRTICKPRMESGKTVKLMGIFQDITDRKKAEDALRESEERYRTLIERIHVAIVVHDADTKIVTSNPIAGTLLGLSEDQMSGKTVADPGWKFFREDGTTLPLAEYPVNQVVACRQPLRDFTCGIYRPNTNDLVWGLVNADPVFDDTGEILEVIVTFIDITEHKIAQEEKVQLEQQFHQSQKLESIGRLAGGVAHDLNNLLSPILGYGEMLMDNSIEMENRHDAVEQIVNAGLRARDLVRQLLAFSRKQALEFKPVDLNALIMNFEKLLRRTIREDIAIRLNLAFSLPHITGDIGQLEQVVMNLSVNAQDAMPDGGELTIETGRVELDDTYAGKHQSVIPGSYVVLIVSDTGSGFSEEVGKHLFEPFFTTKSQDKGTGLGLASVYGIVKQHGGNVWAYSEPGQGSVFKVYLPVSMEPPDSRADSGSPSSPLRRQNTETILLVEDNQQVRELTLAILEREGYTVLAARTGKEATRIINEHAGPVHMILTDVVMPDMNGKTLYRQISKSYPQIKVLYMSGYTDNVIVHRGVVDAGVNFIQKPFSIRTLTTKIRGILDE